MVRKIHESVVVVTGASTGIGRATALEFAKRGAAVALLGRREPLLQRLARECEREGGRALAVACDVTDEGAVKSAARQVVDQFGRIDVWVNNAAVTMFGRFEESPYDDFRKVIETNLFGYIHGARSAIPHFREQGSGTLVNVASVVSKIGSPYASAYAISKAGIVGLSDSLRMELHDAPGIHVCTILPASIDTPLFQHGANYFGRAAKPMEPVYPAEKVAHAIVSAVKHGRRETMVGHAARQFTAMRTLSTSLAERMFARLVEKRHFQDRPAQPSRGNLYEPMEEYFGTSGGWQAKGRKRGGAFAALAAVAAVGLGILATRRRTRRKPRLAWR